MRTLLARGRWSRAGVVLVVLGAAASCRRPLALPDAAVDLAQLDDLGEQAIKDRNGPSEGSMPLDGGPSSEGSSMPDVPTETMPDLAIDPALDAPLVDAAVDPKPLMPASILEVCRREPGDRLLPPTKADFEALLFRRWIRCTKDGIAIRKHAALDLAPDSWTALEWSGSILIPSVGADASGKIEIVKEGYSDGTPYFSLDFWMPEGVRIMIPLLTDAPRQLVIANTPAPSSEDWVYVPASDVTGGPPSEDPALIPGKDPVEPAPANCSLTPGAVEVPGDVGTVNASLLGRWLRCEDGLAGGSHPGIQFFDDGHYLFLKRDGLGDLVPGSGLNYRGLFEVRALEPKGYELGLRLDRAWGQSLRPTFTATPRFIEFDESMLRYVRDPP